MAPRKITRTPSTPTVTPATPAAKPRRPAAPRRAVRPPQETPASVAFTPPTEEEIRVRAYFLSLERGTPSADPRADWLRAEQELAAGRDATPATSTGQS